MTTGRGPSTTIVLAAVAVLVVAGGGVTLVRQLDLVPLPPPPQLEPAPDLLDPAGLGDVRLGQGFRDFLDAGCEGDCLDEGVVSLVRDDEHDCTLYPMTAPGAGTGSWAWLRDGAVVGVGVATGEHVPAGGETSLSAVTVRTWPGPALGAAMVPRPDELDRWEQDALAPVPVFRREHGGTTTTLADTTGDGRLAYATVTTTAGEDCAVAEDSPGWYSTPEDLVAATEPIVDGSLAGVALGMPADEARLVQGWQSSDSWSPPLGADRRAGCRELWRSTGLATAALADGHVIGLQAFAIEGGPRAGMPLERALELLRPGTVEASLPWEDFSPAGGRSHGWGVVTGTDDAGRRITLDVVREPARVAGLDVPVTSPAAAEPPVVAAVVVGETCSRPGTG